MKCLYRSINSINRIAVVFYCNISIELIFTMFFSPLLFPLSGSTFQPVATETRLGVVLYDGHYSSMAPLGSVSV